MICTNSDALLCIIEAGHDFANFNAKEIIDNWFSDRVRSLTSSCWRYPQKQKYLNDTPVVNVIKLKMSHLEDEELSALDELFRLKEILSFLSVYDIMFFVLLISVVLIEYYTFTAYSISYFIFKKVSFLSNCIIIS